jgi:hypothetical protein
VLSSGCVSVLCAVVCAALGIALQMPSLLQVGVFKVERLCKLYLIVLRGREQGMDC